MGEWVWSSTEQVEQVSSDNCQMLVVGGRYSGSISRGTQGSMLEGGGRCPCPIFTGEGVRYSEDQCFVGVMITWEPPPNRLTDTCENITSQQLRLQAVTNERGLKRGVCPCIPGCLNPPMEWSPIPSPVILLGRGGLS